MQTYYVTYAVEARFVTKVQAQDETEALKKAEDEFSRADFGVASDIDGSAVIVEDENGNFVWEK